MLIAKPAFRVVGLGLGHAQLVLKQFRTQEDWMMDYANIRENANVRADGVTKPARSNKKVRQALHRFSVNCMLCFVRRSRPLSLAFGLEHLQRTDGYGRLEAIQPTLTAQGTHYGNQGKNRRALTEFKAPQSGDSDTRLFGQLYLADIASHPGSAKLFAQVSL
jgi:hypothetical protein